MRTDKNTTIDNVKSEIKKYCAERDWDQYHTAKELAINISIESAELLELFRFKSPENIQHMFESPESKNRIGDELSDVLFAVFRFAQLYDIDLTSEFDRKMIENKQKYPVDKARGSNKKYDEC
jgi:NTP pyrophosphatase (non-canonical NTP hydrolase)